MKHGLVKGDFAQSPFIVIWEMTRSCALKCVHCRAEAIDRRDPRELSTDDAVRLLEEIKRFGDPSPLVVLTGGDPMRRPDAAYIVRVGTRMGLRMTMTPSGTNEMTQEKVQELKAAGLARLAVSLDGATPESHDAFRKVPGSFEWTLNIIEWARTAGLHVQINTTLSKVNVDEFDVMAELVDKLGIVLWSVFFLVPIGRADAGAALSGAECERIFRKMAALSRRVAFGIKSTEAPPYRRVLMQTAETAVPGARRAGPDVIGRAPAGVNDGNGFVFVSHIGEIFPSGFLPLEAGNVRTDSLVEVYRNSPLFRRLRTPDALKGKCGVCDYRTLCGGSRAKAFAVTGDEMASDPFCVYVPQGYAVGAEEKRHW